jgi:hypothetical protein
MEYYIGDYLYSIFVTICKRQKIGLGMVKLQSLLALI